MMSGGSKLTAMDRIDRARITALANGESFTVEMAARLMEAHAAAATAEVTRERDSFRAGQTLAEGRLLELLDVLRERTDALDEVTRERDEALALAEIRRFNRSRVRYARSHVESVLRWDALRPSERGSLVAALGALNEALETPSDAEARVAELERERDALNHSDALVRAATERWRTDCSTPTFQLVRNAVEAVESAEIARGAAQARVAELEAEVERVRGLLQRGLDLNIVEANGGGVDEWENDVTAALAPQTPPAQLHPATTDLVHRFAAALREKLAAAEQKYGYSDNWRADDWLDECRAQLAAHVAKGDPRDVAAYCAFLWHHGASTAPQEKKEVPRE